MKKLSIVFVTLLVIAGLGVLLLTPREEGVCKLKTVSSVDYLLEYDIVRYSKTTDKKPEVLSDIPENIEGKKLFFNILFTDRQMHGCLIDRGQNDYTIYVDLNGDNSLADEKPLVPRKKKYRKYKSTISIFGPVSLKSDTAADAPFYLFLTNHTGGIHVAPITIIKGDIRIDGAIHEVVLADLDFDGEYKTYFSSEYIKPGSSAYGALCDRLLFDTDRDGKFMNCYFIRLESGPLAKLVKINEQYYSIKISEDKLFATPVNPEFGTLKLNTDKSSMHLFSDTYACMIDSVSTTKLPVGNYSVYYSINYFKDSNGDLWASRSKRTTGSAADFEILANQEITVKFPTSFLLKTTAEYTKKKCEIGIKLFSENNKEYSPLLQKNDKSAPGPVVKIFDEQETSLHVGTMEYG